MLFRPVWNLDIFNGIDNGFFLTEQTDLIGDASACSAASIARSTDAANRAIDIETVERPGTNQGLDRPAIDLVLVDPHAKIEQVGKRSFFSGFDYRFNGTFA